MINSDHKPGILKHSQSNLTLKELEVWSKGGNEARKVTPQGYFGDPAAADPEKGKGEIETFGKVAAEAIETFLQGRYCPPIVGRHQT